MARQRRGGFRPPELRGTLGTLLRTTLQQAGAVRDALERGAREGRSKLDEVRSNRRRQDALAELGEIVLDLIRRGEIDLGELPEARTLVRQLDEIDADGRHDHGHDHDHAHDHDHDDEHDHHHDHDHDDGHDHDHVVHAPSRSRFDERASGDTRPLTKGRGDGTVSSSARPAAPPSKRTGSATGIWRPPAAAAPTEPSTPTATTERIPVAERTPPRRPWPTRTPISQGGINFDEDDENLSEYMHPDDVPPKTPSGTDS